MEDGQWYIGMSHADDGWIEYEDSYFAVIWACKKGREQV